MAISESPQIGERTIVQKGQALKRAMQEFVRRASIEVSVYDESCFSALADILYPGTSVYIAHTPNVMLSDIARSALKLQRLGLHASPHLAARRIGSREALTAGLRQLSEAGVDQALLIAGDLARPAGPFSSTPDIIDAGVLQDSSLRCLAVAGHPEGHGKVSDEALLAALRYKQASAAKTGLQMHVVTQFAFDAVAITTWSDRSSRAGIHLPVHVGVAGPTPIPKLIKYAITCGVGASLASVMKNMRIARATASPDELLVRLLHSFAARSSCHIVQPHFYAFGGAVATATWIRHVAEGNFEINDETDRFEMNIKEER